MLNRMEERSIKKKKNNQNITHIEGCHRSCRVSRDELDLHADMSEHEFVIRSEPATFYEQSKLYSPHLVHLEMTKTKWREKGK